MPSEAPPVIVWMLIPLLLGWVIARYYFQREDVWSLAGLTSSIAIISTLVGVNLFYRLSGHLEPSVTKTGFLYLAVAALLFWRRPKEELRFQQPPRWVNLILGILTLVVFAYTNAQQIAMPDDDYWIHAPLQGLMRYDSFPPANPFFSDIPMNGHYGRNLSISIFAYLSEIDVFLSQHVLTTTYQILSLWLFFSAFYYSSGRYPAALLGTIFVYFGINAGGRGGLIDTMQNNNPLVQLYLAALCFMVVEVWKRGRVVPTILCGICLGSYAIVYETHFGLVSLTIIGVTPILWARGALSRRQVVAALGVLLVSLPLAFTQGGPLTYLSHRKSPAQQADAVSKGMQNQAQLVKVTFPKKELFQILLETGEYQRASYIYRLDTPLKIFHTPTTERGYAYIWSWDVLKIHFLALYLAPWAAFILIRRNSLAGLFMGAFGTIAFLVPALVNFGPIYESEYYRWQYAAALGLAGALGLALSTLIEKAEGRPFLLTGTELVINPSGKRYLLLGFLTLMNSWASLTLVGSRFAESVTFNPKTWLIFPSSKEWLASHSVLNFDHLDYEAATWLKEHVQPGDRLLTNFPEENNYSPSYESTITGFTGARCVGHALPLENEKIGTTPYRRSPAAQLFWQTFRPDPLAQLKVDWVFVQTEEPTLPTIAGATLVQTFKHGIRRRAVYRVNKGTLPELSTEGKEAPAAPARLVNVPSSMRGGKVYYLKLETESEDSFAGTLILSTTRNSDGFTSSPSEDLQIRVESGFQRVPFVAPYDEGEYTLRATFVPDEGSPGLDIADSSFTSQFGAALHEIELEDVVFVKVPGTRRLLFPQAKLKLPDSLPEPRRILACWAFYEVEKKEFDLPPIHNLKEVELTEEFTQLPCITPEKPGKYRLSLYLSTGQSHLVRVLGKEVEIR